MLQNLLMNSQQSKADPVVSICVQTYQHAAFIGQCLDGILMQITDFPFEIIVGEDDSSDGTREICKSYAEKYPDKIRLFLRSRSDVHYVNGQATGRFNFTQNYKAARGKYIAFCEGDDYWTDKNKLQMQVSFLESNPDFSLTHTNVNHVDKDGNVTLHAPLNYKEVMVHEEVAGAITVQLLTIVFRKDALPDFPPEFYKVFNADFFLSALLSEKGKVRFFNVVTGCYRKHEGGIFSGVRMKAKQINRLGTLLTMLDFFSSSKVKSTLKTAISKSYARVLYGCLREHDYRSFCQYFIRSLSFDVRNLRFTFPRLILYSIKRS